MASKNQYYFFSLAFVLVVLVHSASQLASSRPLDHDNKLSMRERHEQWMAKHGRVYKDEAEKEKRFHIFMENVKRIEDFNEGGAKQSYKLGVNSFADLTIDEVRATRTGYKSQFPSCPKRAMVEGEELTQEVPSSMDWRKLGAVTSIKDQGQCGCCWAFSTVAAIEGVNQLKTGNLISLSEQQLVDCDQNNNGCNGGFMDLAFTFIQQTNGGLLTEGEYPYTGVQGQCQATTSTATTTTTVTIDGCHDVPPNDEIALMRAVARHPVSVGIDGGDRKFLHYKSGIFTGDCGTDMNHAVTIVGYGSEDDESINGTSLDYWLVKNSWGNSWGEDGYMRILRGVNLCGISNMASYPIKSSY